MPVTVYTKNQCAPCQMLKRWLASKHIEYTEKNIDDPQLMDEMIKKTGMMSVPQTVVGDRVISGPNFSLLSQTLMV